MKQFLLIPMLLISLRAFAPCTEAAWIELPEPDSGFEPLIKAVMMTESSGNVMAYNTEENAVGAFQIREIRLIDYNRRTGSDYKLHQCYDLEISRMIFLHYAQSIGYPNFERIAKKWNGSGKMTIEYWKRVKKHL